MATHSDRLVRFLEPSEVLVLDSNEDGTPRITWADEMDIEEWLAEYTLDELWQKGAHRRACLSVAIALMIEGATEKVLLPSLRFLLQARLAGKMPKLVSHLYDGRIAKEKRLKKGVSLLLRRHDFVIALTDVYTGSAQVCVELQSFLSSILTMCET